MVKALAGSFSWKFARVQFTPDLMPSDITGYELLSRDGHENNGATTMVFRQGPVFANLVLADEINRAAPKTQSALLEAMAEQHVTVGGRTYPLEPPFLVVATQNPIEQEGTYPLPEAQLDRFMMEIRLDYPTPEQEEEIVMKTTGRATAMPEAMLDRAAFMQLRELVQAAPVPRIDGLRRGYALPSQPARRSPGRKIHHRICPLGRRAARIAKSGAGRQSPGTVDGPHRSDGRRRSGRRPAGAAASDHSQSSGRGRQHRHAADHRASAGGERSMSRTTAGTSRYLDLRALASLVNMRFTARHRTEGPYSGRYPSRQLGGAGEFVDYREYSDGEDLRRLDWKVLGRSGRAYIRLYQDETNLCCTFALDCSGSMRFGGPRIKNTRPRCRRSTMQSISPRRSAI